MLQGYETILRDYRPYVIATTGLLGRLNMSPLGLSVAPEDRFDPLRRSSETLLGLLERLDGLTYGPLGMTMPRWAFYDCAELPGLITGLGRSASSLPPRLREALHVRPGYDGIVPMSMSLAVPMLEEHHWLGYSICSLNEVSPGASPRGMRALTIGFTLDMLDARKITGTTQWCSPKLHVHALFAPLTVLTAWLPAHTEPATCTFRFDAGEERIARALTGGIAESEGELLDVSEVSVLQDLQREIEAGHSVRIVGLPREAGARLDVPFVREGPP